QPLRVRVLVNPRIRERPERDPLRLLVSVPLDLHQTSTQSRLSLPAVPAVARLPEHLAGLLPGRVDELHRPRRPALSVVATHARAARPGASPPAGSPRQARTRAQRGSQLRSRTRP